MAELKNTETTFPVSREKKTEETNNIAKTETKSTQNLTVTKTQSLKHTKPQNHGRTRGCIRNNAGWC